MLQNAKWENFHKVIKTAMIACKISQHEVSNHFAEVRKMVEIGSGAKRNQTDYKLTRYACYLIVMNGDPRKEVIAQGQTYFAVKTRQQELAEQYPRKCTAVYTIFNDAYKRALRNKLIKENPLDNVEVKHIKRRPSRALILEEEQCFVATCREDPHGALYMCCLYQGLRIGEAAALDAGDINFEARTLTISKSVDRDGTVGAPKTEPSKRTMPLFARTAHILPHKKEGKLFEYSKGTYQNFMNKLCKKLQLTGISVHSLRHTFATRYAESGIAPKVVQKWLGHSTINMTLDIYTHVNTDFEHSEIQKFDTYSR